MRNPLNRRVTTVGLFLLGAMAARAGGYDIKKNDVIPVRFDETLSTSTNESGDRFTASVQHTDLFPEGTKFDGHVVRVEQKDRRHSASMDLAFDDVLLPDGTKQPIDGVPIPLSDKYVNHDRDGHYSAKSSVRPSTAVGLGALGGLIIGTILHKPFEGAFVGTLAGVLVAATSQDGDKTMEIKKGSEAGVLFNRDVQFDNRASSSDRDEHRDDRRDDHRNGGDPRLSVIIGGQHMNYDRDLAPYRIGSVTMVPIELTAKQLKLNFEEAEGSIFVENDDHSLRLEPNSKGYRIDGRSSQLSNEVEKRNGVWYAPSTVFEACLGK